MTYSEIPEDFNLNKGYGFNESGLDKWDFEDREMSESLLKCKSNVTVDLRKRCPR